jgi:hypothetical protein
MIGGLLKSASSAALFAALGLVSVAGVSPATAADLGGDCCADLEERVAELEATTARKGNRKVSLTISGQVTTAVMAWDDGKDSDVYIVDPPTVGGTFFQFAGNAKINPNVTAGFLVQVGLDRGARSHQVSQTDDDGASAGAGAGDSTMVVTLANWYLDHKTLGRVTVGRANTATAGITGIDLGGAGVIANVNVGYWNRSFEAVGTGLNWADLLGGGTVNGSTLSRGNVINYTTPTVGGFSASAAWGENNVWDVALRYAGEFSGFRVAAGIGYSDNASGVGEINNDATDNALGAEPKMVKGSASILHVATGLYVSGAYIRQDNDGNAANALGDREDTTLWYVNSGISKNWTGLGNTVLYGEYARVEDGVQSTTNSVAGGSKNALGTSQFGSEATVWGLGVVQHIDAAAMELFLSYRHYDGETDAFGAGENAVPSKSSEMDVVMGGARIRF